MGYPILKYSYKYKKSIFSTAFTIEICLILLSLPLLIYIFNNFYDKNLTQFEWLSIVMIFLTIPGFIAHFLLLGLFRVRAVLIIDILATIAKFAIGFILVFMGYGAFGILIALVFHIFLVSLFSFYIIRDEFSFTLDLKIFKMLFREGITNTPSRISRIFIFSLSIVLLALFGIDVSQIGIFYMAITISLVAGGFATNIALMVIPASIRSEKDIAPSGLRIGLSFTIPFVIILITNSASILGLIGENYISASLDLTILALSILPASITIIAISEFNTTNQLKKILVIGITEILVFLIVFSIIVPTIGVLGASIATLTTFSVSAVLSIFWIKRISIKYIINSTFTLVVGITIWKLLDLLFGNDGILNIVIVIIILISSTAMNFYLNKITLFELKGMIQSLYKKGS